MVVRVDTREANSVLVLLNDLLQVLVVVAGVAGVADVVDLRDDGKFRGILVNHLGILVDVVDAPFKDFRFFLLREFSDNRVLFLLFIRVVVIVVMDLEVDDVGAVLLEERSLTTFDFWALWIALPVTEEATVKALARLLLLAGGACRGTA